MKNTKSMHPTVFSALHTNCKEELDELYKSWAKRYDADVLNTIGYIGHIISTELLLKYLSATDARILDAGCGTGEETMFLASLGARKIIGIDTSDGSLEYARARARDAGLDNVEFRHVSVLDTETFATGSGS